jgi:phage protein D
MIFKSDFPNAPVVRMSIDGVAVDYTSVESLEISFNENEHDYAHFTFVGLIPRAVTEYLNRPVYISISASPDRTTTFYGYVGYVEPEAITRKGHINNSPIQRAHLVCFGTSYDMKEKHSAVWESYSITKLVTTLSEKYKYSYAVPTDSFIIPRLVQHNESDWSLLLKACKMVGYRVTVSNAHIHVYDPFRTIARSMPFAQLTTITDQIENASYQPGRVMEFRGSFGQVTPKGSSNNFNVETLDNDGNIRTFKTEEQSMGLGKVLDARFTDTVTLNATSQEAVNKYAVSKIKNRVPFHAEVTVTGVPEVLPGSLVNLAGYDSRFDGFWMVSGIRHKVTRSNYVSELDIVKDSTNDAEPIVVSGNIYVPPDDPILRQGTWIAAVQDGQVYV